MRGNGVPGPPEDEWVLAPNWKCLPRFQERVIIHEGTAQLSQRLSNAPLYQPRARRHSSEEKTRTSD